MSSRKKTLLLTIRVILDLLAVGVSWIFAYFLRFSGLFETTKGLPPIGLYLKVLPFILVIWGLAFSASGFYERSKNKRSAFREALDIMQCCIVASLAFVAFTQFYSEYRYSRLTIVLFGVMHPALVITLRSVLRKSLRIYKKRKPTRNVLIIGGGSLLEKAFDVPAGLEFEVTKIVGVYLVGSAEQISSGKKIAEHQRTKIIPEWPKDIVHFLKSQDVRSVIIAIPSSAHQFLDKNLDAIANQVSDVKVIPDLGTLITLGAAVELIDQAPVISLRESPLEGGGAIVKRWIDIMGSLVAIMILWPVMLFIAILVKLSSPGPVLYRQQRMGLNGHVFDCLKFRSMPVNVEAKSGPVWAKAGENRATGIGQILRKYSLDELPQFFNVLLGDMSLVGPRPERPVFVDDFRQRVPGYMLRHNAKAGITGWAQVNGWRGNTSIEKRIEYDLYYIQNWSIWLDARIVLMTFTEVFSSKNAY